MTSIIEKDGRARHKIIEKGYDLDDIRTKALAIGMIPIEQAETIPISAELPQKEPEPSLWEEIVWFFEGLFA